MNLRLLSIATTALLAANGCSPQDMGVVKDGKSWLGEQAGPKVDSVSDSLLKSAQDAELAGDARASATYYQQLADKNPENAAYAVSLADAVRRMGDPDKALSLYEGVLKANPQHAPALEGRALAQMQRGEFDAAEAGFNELVKSNKATWRSYNGLGVIYAGKQQGGTARQYFDEAQRLSPGNPSILNNVGLAQAMGKDFAGANATLAQAAQLAAPRPAFRRQIDLNNAMVYAAAGKLENAEAIARQYFEGPALNNNMGFYAHLAQDDQLAKTYLNMALTQSKRFYPRAWQNLEALNTQNRGTMLEAVNPLVPNLAAQTEDKPVKPKQQAKQEDPAASKTIQPVTGYLDSPQSVPAAPVAAIPAQPIPPAALPVQAAQAAPPVAPGISPLPAFLTAAPAPVPALAQDVMVIKPPTETATIITPGSTLPEMTVQPGAPALASVSPTPAFLNQLAPAAGGAPAPQAAVPTTVETKVYTAKKSSNGFEAVGDWFGSMLDY